MIFCFFYSAVSVVFSWTAFSLHHSCIDLKIITKTFENTKRYLCKRFTLFNLFTLTFCLKMNRLISDYCTASFRTQTVRMRLLKVVLSFVTLYFLPCLKFAVLINCCYALYRLLLTVVFVTRFHVFILSGIYHCL